MPARSLFARAERQRRSVLFLLVEIAIAVTLPLLAAFADAAELPLHFEPNRGQLAPAARFAARARDGTLSLLPGELVLAQAGATLRLRWIGARLDAPITGESPLAGRVNYVRGADPGRWHLGIPTFGRVRYAGLYPGIDATFYGRDGSVEHDLVVAPGADPAGARLAIVGADAVAIDAAGDLVMTVAGGRVRLRAPSSYQERAGVRVPVESRWQLDGARRARVAVGAYDRARTLVIDPVLTYSTYLGGNGEDNGSGLHVDRTGITMGGNTTSTDLPAPGGAQTANAGGFDSYVAKLDPTGATLLYATYFGGSGDDTERDLVVDGAGDAYVIGETGSADLPTTEGAFDRTCGTDGACGGGPDVFVAKFAGADGTLLYATYLGGSGSDIAGKIAVGPDGSAYLAAYTNSVDLPATDGAYDRTCGTDGACNQTCENDVCTKRRDCFAAKLTPGGGALAYATYLGGSDFDRCFGIGIDAAGRAVVVGSTFSADFPATEGAFDTTCGTDGACDTTCVDETCTTADDAFAAMLTPDGSGLVYATFLGGSGNGDTAIDEYAWAVDVDPNGRAVVVGQTDSTDFPTPNGARTQFGGGVLDAFVVAIDPTGASLAFGTYLGGVGDEQGLGVAVDGLGRIHVTGVTASTDFPQVDPLAGPGNACASCEAGFTDAFVATLDPTGGELLFSTFLGGTNSDYGASIALAGPATVYVAGDAASLDFPTVAPFQATHANPDVVNYDAFITRIPEPHAASRAAGAGLALGAVAARRRRC
jgi:hypothetical protein